MPTTVILGTGIIGLSTAYYLSQLAESESEVDTDTTPTQNNPLAGDSTPGKSKHEIHLVEPAPELFSSASGKAAGFIAKDWYAPAVAPLGEFSFDLHRKLAEEHGGRERWAWSESVSYSLDREESDSELDEEEDEDDEDALDGPEGVSMLRDKKDKSRNDLDWLMSGSSRATLLDAQRAEASTEAEAAAAVQAAAGSEPASTVVSEEDEEHPRWVRAQRSAMQVISDRTSTGQVDPHRLCQFLLQECLARGVKLHHPAHATQLLTEPTGPGSSERTLVRLQFLGPDPEATFTATGTPNSKSPPVDATTDVRTSSTQQPNGRPSLRPTGDSGALPSDETQRNKTTWQSFSSPLDAEGSPINLPVNTAEEDYISFGTTNESSNKQPGSAAGSELRTLDVPCDSLVIAAGCWTPRVYRTLFPNAGRIPRVTALAGHSVVFKSRKWMSEKSRRKLQAKLGHPADSFHPTIPNPTSPSGDSSTSSSTDSASIGRISPTPSLFSRSSSYSSATSASPGEPANASYPPPPYPGTCHAVFTSDRAGYAPEIFSRLSGDVWLGGLNSANIPLPPLPTLAQVDPTAVAKLVATAEALLGALAPASPLPAAPSKPSPLQVSDKDRPRKPSLALLRASLCFRPVAPTGRPVIARMHEADLGDGVRVPGGVFVATGHGPWGISLGLGTGWVVGEMVLGRETSVDVSTLGRWEAGVP